MKILRFRFVALAVITTALAACGGPNAATVAGTVTFDGQPLAGATVTFHPASGSGAIAYGQSDATGRYTLSTGTDAGLVPGDYVATVLATKEIPASSPNAEAIFQPITPAKYTDTAKSGLQFTVQAGENDIPLALESR